MEGHAVLGTRPVHARTLDADLLKGDHEHADELVAPLQTETFVLPVGLVKEDNVEGEREVLGNCAQLGQDVTLEVALLTAAEFQQTLAQAVDLFNSGAVFDDDWNRLGEGTGSALVQNEECVQVAVGGLDDMALHLLEFSVQQSDLLDEVVIAETGITSVTIDGDTVSDIERVLDEDENDGLQEFLGCGGEQPGKSQDTGPSRSEYTGSGGGNQRQENDNRNDNHEEHEDVIQLGHDRVQVLQRRSDGLALTPDLHADSFQLLHRDVAIHITIEHDKSRFGFFVVLKRLLEIAGENSLKAITNKSPIKTTGQDLATRSSSQESENDVVRIAAALGRPARKVSSYRTSDIADLVADLVQCTLGHLVGLSGGLARIVEGSPDSGGSLLGPLFSEGVILLLDATARPGVQLNQAANLKLVDLNSIGISAQVEANGDELNDDLLDQVEDSPDEDDDNDLVERVFPAASGLIAIHVMVLHGGQE